MRSFSRAGSETRIGGASHQAATERLHTHKWSINTHTKIEIVDYNRETSNRLTTILWINAKLQSFCWKFNWKNVNRSLLLNFILFFHCWFGGASLGRVACLWQGTVVALRRMWTERVYYVLWCDSGRSLLRQYCYRVAVKCGMAQAAINDAMQWARYENYQSSELLILMNELEERFQSTWNTHTPFAHRHKHKQLFAFIFSVG